MFRKLTNIFKLLIVLYKNPGKKYCWIKFVAKEELHAFILILLYTYNKVTL